jgi:Ser/Thr protein kinase RdoA (MazF antagonist)
VLFEEAPGGDLVFAGPDGSARAALYGRAAAALHNAAERLANRPNRPALDRETVILRPLDRIGREGDSALVARIGSRLLAAIDGNAGLTHGFAHGDLNMSNIHFTAGHATVIDFDCCGWGWRANELAAFARGVTLTRLPGVEASALIRAYLQGYEAIRPIAAADRAALPAFLIVQRLWMACIHLEGRDHRWGAQSFGPAYVERLMAWLSAWANVLDSPPDWLDSA